MIKNVKKYSFPLTDVISYSSMPSNVFCCPKITAETHLVCHEWLPDEQNMAGTAMELPMVYNVQ